MSFLVGGMQGDVGQHAAAENTDGLPIRERIIRNVSLVLSSIQGIGRATPDETNTIGVEAAPGGAYTGAATRKYRAQVVLAGASGVARVTMTDVTPAEYVGLWPDGETVDDGPVSTVVTSGTPFDVGTLGATLTLTFTGALALGDAWEFFAGDYATSVGAVVRGDDGRETDLAWVEIEFPDEEPEVGPLAKATALLFLDLRLHARRGSGIATDLETLLADVRTALRKDVTRGGLAISTEFVASYGVLLQEARAWGECVLRVAILYRTVDDDPRTL